MKIEYFRYRDREVVLLYLGPGRWRVDQVWYQYHGGPTPFARNKRGKTSDEETARNRYANLVRRYAVKLAIEVLHD